MKYEGIEEFYIEWNDTFCVCSFSQVYSILFINSKDPHNDIWVNEQRKQIFSPFFKLLNLHRAKRQICWHLQLIIIKYRFPWILTFSSRRLEIQWLIASKNSLHRMYIHYCVCICLLKLHLSNIIYHFLLSKGPWLYESSVL